MGFADLGESLEVDLRLLVRVDVAEVGQPLQLILYSLHRRRFGWSLRRLLAPVLSLRLVGLLARVGAVFGDKSIGVVLRRHRGRDVALSIPPFLLV